MAGMAGVTIVESSAERSTERHSDIMVKATFALVGRAGSVCSSVACSGLEGRGGAASALSTTF